MRVDLSGVNALRFNVTLGGDHPPGDEMQRRMFYDIRSAAGTEARFLTVNWWFSASAKAGNSLWIKGLGKRPYLWRRVLQAHYVTPGKGESMSRPADQADSVS